MAVLERRGNLSSTTKTIVGLSIIAAPIISIMILIAMQEIGAKVAL
jgi:hypothetical protein